MTSDILIRTLEPSDAEGFRSLRLEALTVSPEAFGASYEEDASVSMETMRARLSARPNVVLGAFADQALIGMAGFAVYDRVKARHKGVLWGVYVKAEWRGHQVGKRLVQHVIDHASRHVMMLEATVGLTNDGARRTYHGLGFKPYGIQRKALRVGDTFYDEELLYLDLPQPGDA
ncbi:GNAT family N-acetyltransferase [Microvirga sp. BT688]|uniref:GNAT family N-acetyltransferase n=1 Tax=Microvirga sp. TaxID=1873136 RepID=UPI0016843EA9|nr:GNAT family N-acetyltransferase [Microvirga sp.]MBD2746266.1 GNAT family N-acetyltransferase [Microvirga sp.]